MRLRPPSAGAEACIVVENLRVLAIDSPDPKATNSGFGRTVTIEVTPQQVEKINVAKLVRNSQ